MDQCTKEVRMQNWKNIISECQARPEAHYRAGDYEYGINPFDRKYESVQKERNSMVEFLLNAFEIVIGVVASFVVAFIIGMIGMLLSSSELMKTFWGSIFIVIVPILVLLYLVYEKLK